MGRRFATSCLLFVACKGDGVTPTPADSAPGPDETAAPESSFDLLISLPDDLEVRRLRFPARWWEAPPEAVEVVWTWSSSTLGLAAPARPHGLTLDGGRVLVGLLDYGTDGGAVALDLATGALVEALRLPTGQAWGGPVSPSGLRFVHDLSPSAGGYVISDTHNQRVLGVDAAFEPLWELARETSPDPSLRALFSQPNGVELVEIDGEPQLIVSCRGDRFNQVLRFAPAAPLRPHDPPWALADRWPPVPDIDALLENHNPRADARGFSVADSGHDRILWVSWTRGRLRALPEDDCPPAEAPAALRWPRDALETADGHLLVVDTLNHRLAAFAADARCLDAEALVWELGDLGEPYQLLAVPEGA